MGKAACHWLSGCSFGVSVSVGSLTSSSKISRTFASSKQLRVSDSTVERYLDIFRDAFLIEKASRKISRAGNISALLLSIMVC